ncbi:B-cell receptor CD22-like isoform X2 [Brienomyrus brachyistius]|uniref:B-cell receptor CD22-like isoform X2 n=1 Tax=Brienomyrus brachyistius TaxID=42636 RepID=UPI0020B1F041|nr:B-cell receptor CD22-like isoform X2 [Brienomyrus brachyistius]
METEMILTCCIAHCVVLELKVVMTSSRGNGILIEGDSVNLTCSTQSCSLSQTEFIWFKDNQQFPETQSTLHFKPACKYDSGNYSCALKGSKETMSSMLKFTVNGSTWTVYYSEKTLCAVRGSTVVIQCGYDYPESYNVESMMWSHNTENCTGKQYTWYSNNTNISAEYRDRAEFLGNKVKNCTLKIKNVTTIDAGVYRFRFTTNGCEECGQPGVTLQVDELKVVMTSSRGNGTLIEGDSVNLTCSTQSCSLSQTEFIWFKDNQQFPETQSTLHFKPACKYDSGNYSCALKGSEEIMSSMLNFTVNGSTWTVYYSEKTLCAVRGSTVVIQCGYDYPESYNVESMMWSHNTEDCTGKQYTWYSNNTNISAEYRDRAEFLGNKVKNCTLKIKNVTTIDAGVYRFRFTTNGCEECGQPGVSLQVDELKVVMTSSRGNGTLIEGDSVNLTCRTRSCSLSQSEFTWFKDNKPISETNSTLYFNPVFYQNSGKYSCALKGYRNTVSDPVLITCQSTANPTTLILVIVGVLGCLALLAVVGCIMSLSHRRKTESLNEKNDRGGQTQINEDNPKIKESDISQIGNQTQEVASQKEEVSYASVQLNTKESGQKKTDLLNENDRGKKLQITEDDYVYITTPNISQIRNQQKEVSPQKEEVCYASVQFNTEQPKTEYAANDKASDDDAIVYSVVRNTATHS